MMRLCKSLLFPDLEMPFTEQIDWRLAFEMDGIWIVRMRIWTSTDLSSIIISPPRPRQAHGYSTAQ